MQDCGTRLCVHAALVEAAAEDGAHYVRQPRQLPL